MLVIERSGYSLTTSIIRAFDQLVTGGPRVAAFMIRNPESGAYCLSAFIPAGNALSVYS
jgi:hypothetical protein